MNKSRWCLVLTVSIPVVLALTTSGCDTTGFIKTQTTQPARKFSALGPRIQEDYSLLAEGKVNFGFNKSNLGKTEQAALGALVQQAKSMHRVVFELCGPDPVGTTEYDPALSRRRVDSVARYLVQQGIPVRDIHFTGLEKEPALADLLADVQGVDPNTISGNIRRVDRLVLVRLYAADAGIPVSSSTSGNSRDAHLGWNYGHN